MGKLDLLFRGVNIDSESKENDEDLIASITKLLSITKMITDTYKSFIVEFHVAPMNLFQTKLSDIKELKFFLVYNRFLDKEIIESCKEECSDMFDYLVHDEFEDVEKIHEIEFRERADWDIPSIELYTLFTDIDLEKDLPFSDYVALYSIIKTGKYTISIPKAFPYLVKKSIIVHCDKADDIIHLIELLKELKESIGLKMEEFVLNKEQYSPYVYVPMVGLKELSYNIPYMYLTEESFNQQYLKENLIGKVSD